MFLHLFLIAQISHVIELLILKSIRKVLLSDIMIRIVVGILIANAMSKLRCPAVMSILQIRRYRSCLG